MAKQKMEYMKGYSNGYIPPKGSAGGEARGMYSTASNPRPVPEKGSQIGSGPTMTKNADREKIMGLKGQQSMKENLRGYGC